MTYLFSFLFLKSLSENQCVQWLFYSRLKVYFYIVVVCKENPMGRNVFKSTGIICNWPAKYVFQAKVTSDSNMYWREEAGLCLRANFRKGFFLTVCNGHMPANIDCLHSCLYWLINSRVYRLRPDLYHAEVWTQDTKHASWFWRIFNMRNCKATIIPCKLTPQM